ncbi:hypothetical protein TIFTF001_029487 [Ficus carica]|uniref:Uncharacterized protein n=1 Tax=Ficus carica TaxID=3494 RepID=A0AA88DRY3_FICCA|nr:hypothetical protein TIFTF001_029487 [Ficus carica]
MLLQLVHRVPGVPSVGEVHDHNVNPRRQKSLPGTSKAWPRPYMCSWKLSGDRKTYGSPMHNRRPPSLCRPGRPGRPVNCRTCHPQLIGGVTGPTGRASDVSSEMKTQAECARETATPRLPAP